MAGYRAALIDRLRVLEARIAARKARGTPTPTLSLPDRQIWLPSSQAQEEQAQEPLRVGDGEHSLVVDDCQLTVTWATGRRKSWDDMARDYRGPRGDGRLDRGYSASSSSTTSVALHPLPHLPLRLVVVLGVAS